MKKLIIWFVLLLMVPALGLAQEGAFNVNLRFDRYHTTDELNDAMRQLNKAYPELTSLEVIGKSYRGRDMLVLTIFNPETGPELQKPAMWVDANIHGNEIQGGEVALYTAWYILENYATNLKIKNIVDRGVFYILPSLNPDGRDFWFEEANTSGSSRSGQKPTDNDLDGLLDEDGPEDLDGDGYITQMRKRVKDGTHKIDPEDSRLLIRVSPGEVGEFELLGSEGIDNDGDGNINEDGPGGYDPNRNWGYNWMPDYVQGGSGDYPFSLPESKAVRDFFADHPNIAGVQSFHNTGGMILRAPGAKNRGDFPMMDIRSYDALGKIGEQMLPGYRYIIIWKDLYTVYGGSIAWTASGLGIFSFSNELNTRSEYDMNEDDEVDTYERLDYSDLLEFGAWYSDWKPYKHPLYGDIEIGGWTKWSSRIPSAWKLTETCHRNAAFVIYHAMNMPEVVIGDINVEKLGDDLYRVTAKLENKQYIPTRSAQAAKHNLDRKDYAKLQGADLTVITAGKVTDKYRNRIADQERDLETLWIDSIPGKDSLLVQWVVKGSGDVNLEFNSVKGGVAHKAFTLK